ncbi:MAG: YeeE/YedE family protein [Pseudorhodoplanes sp.]
MADANPTADAASKTHGFAALRVVLAGAILIALAAAAFLLHARGGEGPRLALSIVFGALFGIALQRARFCFFCMFREWFDDRDPRGLLALVLALAVGLAGYTLVFGAWLPDAGSGRLPPDAFIGPVSVVLVAAGFAFGAGMAISGSCVSAHLYRLGEGSPTAPFALIGTVAGFILGFLTWNSLYLAAVADAPVVWLPGALGYAGALVAALGALALLALSLSRSRPRRALPSESPHAIWNAVVVRRWPAWVGGLLVGALGAASYLRVAPLGVTAEIGGRARDLANGLGWLPARLEGLDTLRGCVTLVRDAVLSLNGAFVGALVLASFAAALAAGQFTPSRPTAGQVARGLSGGVLLGWGALTGLGCTVGTLLSGVMAGALSGWVFGAAVFAGIAVTLHAGRKVGILASPGAS